MLSWTVVNTQMKENICWTKQQLQYQAMPVWRAYWTGDPVHVDANTLCHFCWQWKVQKLIGSDTYRWRWYIFMDVNCHKTPQKKKASTELNDWIVISRNRRAKYLPVPVPPLFQVWSWFLPVVVQRCMRAQEDEVGQAFLSTLSCKSSLSVLVPAVLHGLLQSPQSL